MHNAYVPNYKADPKMAERLVKARIYAGCEKSVDGARKTKTRFPTYHAHENGSRGFTRRLKHYANVYRVDPHWLLTGDGNMIARYSGDPLRDGLSERALAELVAYAELLRLRDSRQ